MSRRGLAFLRLMRAHSAFGAALLVPFGAALAGERAWDARWVLPAVLAFVLAAWGNVDNDIHDVAIDRLNRPRRPLPSGVVSVREARHMAAVLAGVALGVSWWLGWVALTGCVAALALTAAYTRRLKGYGLVGPALVGMLTMWPLAFGGLLAGNLLGVLPAGVVVAALFGAREVVKTVHDCVGDAAAGVNTVAGEGSVAALSMAVVFLPVWAAPDAGQCVARVLVWSKVVGLLCLVGLLLG